MNQRSFMRAILYRRTTAITQPEQLTQRKSKRPIEGLACIAWFVGILGSSPVRHNVLSDLSGLPCNCIRAIARGSPEFWIEADVL